MQAFLSAWAALVQTVGAIVDDALDVEPAGGSTVSWRARCEEAAVASRPDADRVAEARAAGQTKGPPASEVLAVLQRQVRLHLPGLLSGLSAPQQAVARASVETLVSEATKQFATKSREVVKRGLFKHAKATAALHRSGTRSRPETSVMTCPTCGGPRQTEALACVFCGGAL